MDNPESVAKRLQELKSSEFEIVEEIAGITRMIGRYSERVTELGPKLRAIRGEIRRLIGAASRAA